MSEIIAEQSIPNQLKKIERDENGLIKGVNYVFDEFGFVNWRAMIPKQYLVANKTLFNKNGKKVPDDITSLDDKELLILLGGIRQLAAWRGFTEVNYQVTSPSIDQVITVCSVKFLPNYEAEGKEIIYSAVADANLSNTNGFGKYYLSAISENRSFVRAVRGFLRILIVGADEVNIAVPDGQSNSNTKMVTTALLEVMNSNNITFEIIKDKLIKEKFVDDSGKSAENYTCINDIDTAKQFELISRIKSKAKKSE
jgi:hypothetical protein